MNLKLKAKIIENYGSQVDFSEAINVNETIISKVIRGRRTLDPEKQIIWAQALRSTPLELFGRDQV